MGITNQESPPTSAKRILSSRVASLPLTSYTLRSSLTASTYLAGQHGRIITLLQIDNIKSSQILTSQRRHFILKPILNWVKCLFTKHISDSSTNYDSFLNWTFSSLNMVWTVQTLLCSQMACNEIKLKASARTCSRQHDQKCRLKSSHLKSINFHHPSQGTSTNYYLILGLWDKAAPATSQHINKFPLKRVKNLVTPSSIFIFIFSSSTGEFCSQLIRGNDRRIGQMFPEHVEWSFLDPEYSFNGYFTSN